jgi:putative glutamine amidotransferase
VALGLIEAMVARGKPVFGICRGFQEINVAFGGTLTREVGAAEALAHHAPDDADLEAMFGHRHEIALTPGGVLARASGGDRMTVNSVHYQGVERLGRDLAVEARAPDGLVEAVSARIGGAPILAVQWHPEWRTQEDAASQLVFRLLGRALRGDRLETTV